MKKVVISILILLSLTAAGGIYYFNSTFLPAFLRKTVAEKGQNLINRGISFETIEYRFGKGVLIKNLRVAQKGHPDKIFFQAQEISSEIPLIPLLKEKKIILPQISVRGFSAAVFRISENTWNFSDLFSPKVQTEDAPFQILLGKISLTQGQISVTDLTHTFEPAIISVAHLQAGLSLPQHINFSFAGEIPAEQTTLSMKGSYTIAEKSISLSAQAINLDLVKKVFPFLAAPPELDTAFIRHTDITASWKNRVLECRGDLAADIKGRAGSLIGQGTIESRATHLIIKDDHLSLKINALLIDRASFQIADSVAFAGKIQTGGIQFLKEERMDFDDVKKSHFQLSADVSLSPDTLKFNDTILTSNDIIMTGLSFKKSPYETHITTGLSCEAVTLSQNGLTVSGNLSIPSLQASSIRDTWTILSPFSLKKASAGMPNVFSAVMPELTIESLETIQSLSGFSIAGTAKGTPLEITFPGNKAGHIIPNDISFSIAQSAAPSTGLTYEITASVSEGRFSQVFPHMNELKDVRGKLIISNDIITLDPLWVTADETPANITGDIRNFSKWIAGLSITAKDIRIQDWIHLAKDALQPHGLSVTGNADVTVLIKGPLVVPEQLRFSLDALIKTADIRSSKYPYTFQGIKGGFKYSEDSLAWDNLQFSYQNEPYESTGSLRRFTEPIIAVRIRGRDMNLSASAESVNGVYEISRADLKTKLSMLSGSGKITPDKDAPSAQANIQGYIVLSDLEQLHPFLKEKIKEWDIRGHGNITLNYAGLLNDPLNARLSLTYQSEQTSVKNFRFDNLYLKTSQPNPYENIFDISTLFHNGKIAVSGNIQFQNDFPFKVQGEASNVDISKLTAELPIKDQKIAGLLTTNLFLQGNAKKTESITGQGDIKIEQGYFVKPNFLKGIISLILSQEYQDVVFTDAKAKLFVRNNQLRLADIFVKSSAVDLSGYGWIDMTKNIDFTITPNFRIPSSMKTDLLKSGTKNVIEKYLSIRATGSLMKPRYSTQIDPSAVMQDAADILGEGVQSIFRGLGF